MNRFWILAGVWISLIATARIADAQISVQQPVVSTFSVSTTVSVPDSGAGFLGRVSRAGASRSSYGPFRSGTSSGVFRRDSAASARVRIHDFASMDERLLRLGSPRSSGPVLSGYAKHAFSSLTSRRLPAGPDSIGQRRLLALGKRSESSSSVAKLKSPRRKRTHLKADRSYHLGLQAIERGKTGLAKLHFKTAAKLGSAIAKKELSSLK